jgi:hypothetical protein
VERACSPSIWRLRQEDLEFEDSLSYIGKSCLKNGRKGRKETQDQRGNKAVTVVIKTVIQVVVFVTPKFNSLL